MILWFWKCPDLEQNIKKVSGILFLTSSNYLWYFLHLHRGKVSLFSNEWGEHKFQMVWSLWQQCVGQPDPELQDSWVFVHLHHPVLTLEVTGHQRFAGYGSPWASSEQWSSSHSYWAWNSCLLPKSLFPCKGSTFSPHFTTWVTARMMGRDGTSGRNSSNKWPLWQIHHRSLSNTVCCRDSGGIWVEINQDCWL